MCLGLAACSWPWRCQEGAHSRKAGADGCLGEGEARGEESPEFGRGFLAFPGMGAGAPGALMGRQLREQAQTRWGWQAGCLDLLLLGLPPPAPWNVISPLINQRLGKNRRWHLCSVLLRGGVGFFCSAGSVGGGWEARSKRILA